MSDKRKHLAPGECDQHRGGTFRIGIAGGMFYACGCVWDNTPGKVVDGKTGPWFRGMCRDERERVS